MLDRLVGAVLNWVVPRIGSFVSGAISRISSWWNRMKERRSLSKNQEARLEQADKVEKLRQALIQIEKGEVQVSNEKKKELMEQLRQESRKLINSK